MRLCNGCANELWLKPPADLQAQVSKLLSVPLIGSVGKIVGFTLPRLRNIHLLMN